MARTPVRILGLALAAAGGLFVLWTWPRPSGPRGVVAAESVRLPEPRQTVRGRVLEYGAERPVAGVELRLLSSGSVRAATRSDERGDFELTSDTRSDCRLVVQPPPSFWVARAPGGLRAEHWAGARLHVVLAPHELAAYRGWIVDLFTDEPVPFQTLQVRTPTGVLETVQSDAGGRFATGGLYPKGRMRLERPLAEGPDGYPVPSTHVHSPSRGLAAEARVRIAVGPTYRLALELPDGVALEHLGACLEAEDALDLRLAKRHAPNTLHPLHPGQPPWVRIPHLALRAPSAWLVVRTHCGEYEGRARVGPTRGIRREPLVIRVEPVLEAGAALANGDG